MDETDEGHEGQARTVRVPLRPGSDPFSRP
ncbi:MAG: hypothetical protein QG671_4069, partial [Actinomycetota bacterium]|nr:hypothetical protein [Actinomycetota bacterium]